MNTLCPSMPTTRRCTTLGQLALNSAIVLRDCSFYGRSSPPERRACRVLMREAALKWSRSTVRIAT